HKRVRYAAQSILTTFPSIPRRPFRESVPIALRYGVRPLTTTEEETIRATFVSPRFVPTYWSYESSLRLAGKRCLLPPLGLITVAALMPRHWRPQLVDLNVEALSDRQILRSDVVLLTGMHVQRDS